MNFKKAAINFDKLTAAVYTFYFILFLQNIKGALHPRFLPGCS